jgi:hypothetical protein
MILPVGDDSGRIQNPEGTQETGVSRKSEKIGRADM